MGIKRTKEDAVFSDLVRERVGFICERCGHYEPEGVSRQAMHCSHFYSRGSGNRLRWNPLNGTCLCASCHRWLGEHPDDHTTFIKQKLGSDYELLAKAKRMPPLKMSKNDKQEMHEFYREELKRIRKLRMDGHTDRLDFRGWEYGESSC